jgi:hypothetical protein
MFARRPEFPIRPLPHTKDLAHGPIASALRLSETATFILVHGRELQLSPVKSACGGVILALDPDASRRRRVLWRPLCCV